MIFLCGKLILRKIRSFQMYKNGLCMTPWYRYWIICDPSKSKKGSYSRPWLGLDTKVVVPILEFQFKNMKLSKGPFNNYVDQFWPNFHFDPPTPFEWTSVDILYSTKCSLLKVFPLMSFSYHFSIFVFRWFWLTKLRKYQNIT